LFLLLPALLPALLSGLALQSTVSGARPEPRIVCAGPLPFSEAEMAEALRARRPLLGSASSVEVRAVEGRTLLRVGAAEREVELGELDGADAARMVAVLALDLAQSDSPVAVASPAPRPLSRPGDYAFRAGLSLLSPFGEPGWAAHFEPTLDLALGAAHGFGAFVTAGYRWVAAGTAAGDTLEMRELPLRAGVSYRRHWLELRLGAMVRPRVVEGAGSYRGASFGGVAAAVARRMVTRKLAVVVGAGVDVSRNRTIFSVGHEAVLEAGWLAPWLAAGLAWETAL
jgi:hypothetical protein